MILKNVFAVSSLLMLSTVTIAKVHLQPLKCNEILLSAVDPIIIDLNESQVRLIGNLRIESALAESNHLTLNLSYKDENGKFVMFYRSEPMQVADGDEIGIACPEGFSLTLKVEITE